jgi:two-component system OmpR family sensor kinase
MVHTPSSAAIDVTVGTTDDGTGFIEVRDDGPGMRADVAAHAFERFYRADQSRSRHQGGSGLGLAIVDATVRAHGGSVTLDTAAGRGTAVRVELPST